MSVGSTMDDFYILRIKLTFFLTSGQTKSVNIQNLYISHTIVPTEIHFIYATVCSIDF